MSRPTALTNTVIQWSRITHRYEVYINGQNKGSAANYADADKLLKAERKAGRG